MKTPIVPQLTGEEQVAIHAMQTMCLLEGRAVSAKEAYDAWLKMDEALRKRMWNAWHLLHLNAQN